MSQWAGGPTGGGADVGTAQAAISAELTAIESVGRRTDENQPVRYAAVVDRG